MVPSTLDNQLSNDQWSSVPWSYHQAFSKGI
jgi:hypothetical protein